MSPIFSVFDLVILACIAQGLITSLLLFKSKESRVSKRLLGMALIVLCIVSFRIVFHHVGWSKIPEIRYFPLGWELFISPLCYLYVASLTQKEFNWRPVYLLHFIPGTLYVAYDLFIYLKTLQVKTLDLQWQIASSFNYNQINNLEDYFIIASSFIYIFLCIDLIVKFRGFTQKLKLKQAEVIYNWLKRVFILMGLVATFHLINELIDTFGEKPVPGLFHWRFFNLYLAATIYYIGFKGYRLEKTSIHASKLNISSVTAKLSHKNTAQVEQMLAALLEKEAVYLNPNLTLNQLAEKLDTSTETLSFVINQKFDKNFRDLMNSYRVNAVKLKLEQSDSGMSILDIALNSGFNSQASFYRAFKKFENMTPKAYLATKS